MIRKLLIANRGEIACRIIRTCKQMGITSVAIYSDADKGALHVEMADEAVHVGASTATDSYLNGEKIIAAAKHTNADAIHPAYGFLAENAEFARAVREAGLTYIAPSADAIAAMGNKKVAKQLLQGIPYIPDYTDDNQSLEAFSAAADDIGYPIMVKAAAGGGGKGMRLVNTPNELEGAVASAQREALQAFGDMTLMLEKAIAPARHIEVQIIGDEHGNVIALGDRECSIQRRHQKIIEESPAHGLPYDVRQALHETAVSVAKQINYGNAGTVEFLLDSDNNFYFIEMNTRLQVEHPVTEAVYAVDLVRWQLEIAQGTNLFDLLPPFADENFAYAPDGHAIEVRVYAENPANSFLPVTGDVLLWDEPDGVRVDSGVRNGDTVSQHYDPMLAKIIAHAHNRESAIRRLDYALSKLVFLGMENNVSFLRKVLTHPDYIDGNIHTTFLDENPELIQQSPLSEIAIIAATISKIGTLSSHWRNNGHRPVMHQFQYQGDMIDVSMVSNGGKPCRITIDDTVYSIRVVSQDNHTLRLDVNGHQQTVVVVSDNDSFWVRTQDGVFKLVWIDPLPIPTVDNTQQGSLLAPMTGQVIQVDVTVGQVVEQGDVVMILEAMKMEHRITAPYNGTVETVRFAVGDTVQQDEHLLSIIPLSDDL